MKKNAKAKKQQMMFLRSRRGVIMIALIAVLVLVINIISASFSWFTPNEENKLSMSYSFTGTVRSENCTMYHYLGNKLRSADGDILDDGQYWGQTVYDSNNSTGSVTIAAGHDAFFKTEILNDDTKNASDISLYIANASNLRGATLAVTYPGNSVRKIPTTQSEDIYLIRDAYVKPKDSADVNHPGKLEVEWFVKAGSSSVTVYLSDIYLLYN